MYSWGSDLYGQLGHGTGSSAKSRAESSQVRSILAAVVSKRGCHSWSLLQKKNQQLPKSYTVPMNSLFALHFFCRVNYQTAA